MEIGDRVRFKGCDKDQRNWGNGDNPAGKLRIGSEYIVSNVEVHSWHTKISVEKIEGKFNSVCFEVLDKGES